VKGTAVIKVLTGSLALLAAAGLAPLPAQTTGDSLAMHSAAAQVAPPAASPPADTASDPDRLGEIADYIRARHHQDEELRGIAEASGLPTDSADLVTCAQAMHWLPRDAFFAEARRVLHRGAVIAVWGYHIPIVREQVVDAAIRHFHDVVVGPYWPPERRLVLDRFATIEFPFSQVAAPEFEMRCAWSLDHFAQYLGTQSATNRYRNAHGADPVPELVASVQASWGGRQLVRDVYFPVLMRAGRT